MNIPNQDLIQTFRELGYDVKSHSSTVDSNAVGLLIARLGKKDQDSGQEAKAATSKGASKVPPPPEKKKKVKPRVLGRYRKKPLDEEGGMETTTASPAASGIIGSTPDTRSPGPGLPEGGPTPLPASQISSTPRPPRPPEGAVRPATPTEGSPGADRSASPASTATQGAGNANAPSTSQNAGAQSETRDATKSKAESNEAGTASPEAPASKPATQEPPAPEVAEEGEDDRKEGGIMPQDVTGDAWSDESKYAPRAIRNLDKHFKDKDKQKRDQSRGSKRPRVQDEDIEPADIEEEEESNQTTSSESETESEESTNGNGGERRESPTRAVRPMSPSVPIRVAAPSMRATPPRPPKSQRQSSAAKTHKKEEEKKQVERTVEVPKVITLSGTLTVQELADKMHVPNTEVIKNLFMKGIMRTVNQPVEFETARELAEEMEYEVIQEEKKALAAKDEAPPGEEDDENRITRPPVVTIMGHVDHGKTSLLDAIRQTKLKLVEGEAGGITQHIGAYHVEVEHEDRVRQIVFLDTPGHEAFTAMRARGARATDIAILVVAADDGVMPQTIEAIDHAKAAGVPIIVAVNKIDKPGSDPDRVLSQLMEHELLPDTYGGDTVTCNVSAKNQTGLDDLLDMIILVADMQDLKANPDKPATGVIVEAEKSAGRGSVATALVQNGTLREGDCLVVGSVCGRVRALFDDRGNRVKAAGPSMPVEVLGLDDVPRAGEPFEVVDDIADMKNLADERKDIAGRRAHHVTLESLHDMIEAGEVKELNVIIKADVQGTAEAIADSVRKLNDENVQVRVLRAASGNISENDVNLAASSDAIIIGFNSQPDANARSVADESSVDIRTYSIIYQITEDLTKAVQGLLEPIRKEVKTGTAEVRQVFKVGKGLVIAGCMVLDGKITRGSIARVDRDGEIVHDGKVDTLKRFKDDVREVAAGFECGLSFDKFSDIQEGDKINVFVIEETKRG